MSRNWKERAIEEHPERVAAFVIVAIFFAFGICCWLVYEQLHERKAREAVLSALNDLSPNASVTINGETWPQAPVVEALRGLQQLEAHHSYPLEALRVEIRDGDKTVELVVAEDSQRADEYWVYRAGRDYHNDPHGTFVGRIETHVFQDKSQAAGQ